MIAETEFPPALVSEIFSNERDWLVDVGRLAPWGVLHIHPKGRLTVKQIAEALAAQKLLLNGRGQLRFSLTEHGTTFLLQRKGGKHMAADGQS